METIRYSTIINAPVRKVWDTMLNQDTYPKWTKHFNETSRYEGSWEKGKEIYFLGTNEEGKSEGMYARIKENIPYQFISIEHLGTIADGKIDTESEEVQKWAHATENYSFSEMDGQTEVAVEMSVPEEYKEHFDVMWANALDELKDLSEN